MSESKPLDAPAQRKRTLPRGGKGTAAAPRVAGGAMPGDALRKTEQQAGQAKRAPNPSNAMWAKAQAAARSARLLADAGDLDGAVNRAYYAVFGATRAALASVRASLAQSKGHSTIVRRFEKHLIGERGFDAALGRRFIGRLSHARWVADYDATGTDRTAAEELIAEAERFLAAVAPHVKKAKA